MKFSVPSLILLVIGAGSVAQAEPKIVRIPEHTVGCSQVVQLSSDIDAIGQQTLLLISLFEAAKLDIGAAEQLTIGAASEHVKVCLQLGTQTGVKVAGIDVVTVPEGDAALSLCGAGAAEQCQAELRAKLGETWAQPIYAVPVLRWKNKVGELLGDVSVASLIETAAGRQPLEEPEPESTLEQTHWLFVAPMENLAASKVGNTPSAATPER